MTLEPASVLMGKVNLALKKERERAPLVTEIECGSGLGFRVALRAFYRAAMPEIEAAGAGEWGIDPYEVDWLKVFTPIEKALWHDIRAANVVLYPQLPVGRYFVDFGNPVAMIAVECDGAAYHLDSDVDEARTAELNRMGWTVYRLTGSQCKRDFDENTQTKSEARQLIDRLASEWGIGRNRSAT